MSKEEEEDGEETLSHLPPAPPAPHPPTALPWVVLTASGDLPAARYAALRSVIRARTRAGYGVFLVPRQPRSFRRLARRLAAATDATGTSLKREAFDTVAALAAGAGVEGHEAPLKGELVALEEQVSAAAMAHRALAGQAAPAPRRRAALTAACDRVVSRLVALALAADDPSSAPPPVLDSRTLLCADDARHLPARARYLDASCGSPGMADPELGVRLQQLAAGGEAPPVFVACADAVGDPEGEAVRLRGQDLGAACVAARLGAACVEVWGGGEAAQCAFTSGDLAEVPHARILRRVGFSESTELATLGGGGAAGAEPLFHPGALFVLRSNGPIPVHLFSLREPGRVLTSIQDPEGAGESPSPSSSSSTSATGGGGGVKAVFARAGVRVISMQQPYMWGEVGWLASVFSIMEAYGLSVGSVGTSETNVTVSLDRVPDERALRRALDDLAQHCEARVIEPCVAVSLVGRRANAVDRLAPALRLAERRGLRTHIVSQAALGAALVADGDEDDARALVRALHAACVEED